MAVSVSAPAGDENEKSVGPAVRTGAGAAAGSGPAAGRNAAGSSRLESKDNNPNWVPTGRVIIHPCNCRCRTCPGCGPRYGWKVRQRLLSKACLFGRPGLLTLTIDRSHFAEPHDAFLIITGRDGYICRLMRLLGVKRWAWTLELQMKTGEGWPHWHLVIDLPPGGLNLERAWHLWRDKWGLGGLDLQAKKNKNAEHALFYVTKYLTKFPQEGFPEWVLEMPRRIRWVGSSKGIGRLVSDREMTPDDTPDSPDAEKSLPRIHRPLAVRMAECGEQINLFREEKTLGDTRKVFLVRLPREIVEAAGKGRHSIPIHEHPGEPSYLLGEWETGELLAKDILAAANNPMSKCQHRWSTMERFRRRRDAQRITQGKEKGLCDKQS